MQRRRSLWFLAGVVCVGIAICLWLRANRGLGKGPETRTAGKQNSPSASATSAPHTKSPFLMLSHQNSASNAAPRTAAASTTNRLAYRLSNTSRPLRQLMRDDKTILLANALIDTRQPLNLSIPDSLRAPAQGGGSYVVQARGPVDDAFRARLQNAGATIVSYIPNNAFLVRVSDAGAQRLAADAQAVLPYEPYYKLDTDLLKQVVENRMLGLDTTLRVTLFPDAGANGIKELTDLGAEVEGEPERSPFGPVVTVIVTDDKLPDVAKLSDTQRIELSHPRKLANDLFRTTLGISIDPVASTNYLNLTGTNVMIALADSGVDFNHPDLTNRVFPSASLDLLSPFDPSGHGTHVAGIIAGSGVMSSTVSNAVGSVTNASFRGMAPMATLYSMILPGYLAGSFGANLGKAREFSDAALQEAAALTNALVDNNSWNYGNASSYDIAAASYDAAVRDAIPEKTGPQPMLFVFSAGNDGNGDDTGVSGDPESILSPGTAKNVITVGAIEENRNITNKMALDAGGTDQPFLGSTDSSNEVAAFSSRGNVGIGIEGDAGRFKPDVVAPGTMIISDASETWDTNAYYNPTNVAISTRTNQTVATNTMKRFSIFVPDNAVGVTISVQTNLDSPSPFPDVLIYARVDDFPNFTTFDAIATNIMFIPPAMPLANTLGHTIFYGIANPTNQTMSFDVETDLYTTNDRPELHLLQTNLNAGLAPWYRYESGTSMSAAGISGMLALMHQFFTQQLGLTNSPALMKALLINGARSLGNPYDLQVASLINYQGWGLPNIANSIPLAFTSLTNGNISNTVVLNQMPMRFFDQSPTNALATGQSQTFQIQLSPNGQQVPLRVTLVWTDPPGNPSAGIKLVNNLDLVVTNLDNTNVFFGNDIPAGGTFNEAWDTNNPPPFDLVNNVQNVFLAPPLGTNYAITVYGRRVNVNAVTANTNAVVQDFALVVSSADGSVLVTNVFAVTNNFVFTTNTTVDVGTLTNGLPLLGQRAGGNSQYAATTNGITNQWRFYVYTNTVFLTNNTYTNVAFVTFAPPEIGVTRMGTGQELNPGNAARPEGDVDLYVSFDPGLTNLDPAVLAAASQSVGRGGTEKVLFTNQPTPGPYYIAVRSQDQEGVEFNLVGVAINRPFDQQNGDGTIAMTILSTLPMNIPDGSPALPGSTTVLALTTDSGTVRRLIVTNGINHPSFSDLIGFVSHGQKSVVLNNHKHFVNPSDTAETLIYDDSGEGTVLPNPNLDTTWPSAQYVKTSDGPGNLTTFQGDQASDGVWMVSMVDDSLGFSGSISNLALAVDPEPPTNHFTIGIGANSSYNFFIDVPANATNLTINISFTGGSQGLDMYVKRGSPASAGNFDFFQVIPPGGGQMVINPFTAPPLNPGRYYVHLFNPNTTAVSVNVDYEILIDTSPPPLPMFLSVGNEPILDDAVTYSTNHVSDNKIVVNTEVGVRIDHPRESDLVLTLISPKGTRCLLAENRGGLDTNGYGSGYFVTNEPGQFSSGGPQGATNVIPTGGNQGTLIINYDFFSVPDTMHVYYDGIKILDSGLISGAGTFQVDFGPGLSTNVTIIIDENSPSTTGDLWQYTATVIESKINYAVFTEDTNKTTLPIKFATPPFGTVTIPPPITNLSSSFETVAPNAYTGSVEGWTVLDTNPVTVVSVPALAPDGSNVLAMHFGTIFQLLPTVAGQKYTISFLSHGRPVEGPVSWWKGDRDATDAMGTNNGVYLGTNYPNGEVKQSFSLNGASQYVDVPDSPSLEIKSNLTLEAWINPADVTADRDIMDKISIATGNHGYQLVLESGTIVGQFNTISQPWPSEIVSSTTTVTPNTWSHVAFTYDQTNMVVYLNGQAVGTKNVGPFQIGTTSANFRIGTDGDLHNFFDGQIDEATVYNTALSPVQIADIYAAGSAGKCPVIAGSCLAQVKMILSGVATNLITALDAWQTNELTFTATGSNTLLELQPQEDGVLIDRVQLVQHPSASLANYYLPEESLNKFQGENAQGDWKLEILDNRAGATNPTPNLVSWQLSMRFENTEPQVQPLTHAIPVTNCVPTSNVLYFSVSVPVWAGYATNILNIVSGSGGQWLLNTNVLPLSGPNDFTLRGNVSAGNTYTNVLQAAPPSTPPLYPGTTYYMAIVNTNPTPLCFTLEMDFNIITLTNLELFTNTIVAGNVPQYYQYDVSTNNPAAASFEFLRNPGNLFMSVRKGPPLPDMGGFDYASQGIGPQAIVVTSNSTPVPLASGRWYIGVFNVDTNPVTYIIMAKESPLNLIGLTNGLPYVYNNQVPGVDISPFYSFNVASTNTAALFEILSPGGNVDLTLGPVAVLPYDPQYFRTSLRLGTNSEQIVIRSNQFVSAGGIGGTWYLGAPNNELTNVFYTIRAVVATNGLLISDVPIHIGLTYPGGTNGIRLTWTSVDGETYNVQTNADLTTTNWGVLSTVTGAPYSTTFQDPNPIIGIPYLFYRIVQVPTP